MKRWIFTILSLLSLLLLLATVVLWIRSGTYEDRWAVRSDEHYFYSSVYSAQSIIEISYARYAAPGGSRSLLRIGGFAVTWENVLFFRSVHQPLPGGWTYSGPGGPGIEIDIPDWFLVLFFLVLPAYWFWASPRRRIIATNGLCAKCGYDLRASKERCPECGTVFGLTPPRRVTSER